MSAITVVMGFAPWMIPVLSVVAFTNCRRNHVEHPVHHSSHFIAFQLFPTYLTNPRMGRVWVTHANNSKKMASQPIGTIPKP